MPLLNEKVGKATILFVLNDPRFFITHRLALAEGIKKAGYTVHVAVPTRGYGSVGHVIEQSGVILHEVGIERQGLNPVSDLRAMVRLMRLYRRIHPDIVHHVTIKPVLLGSIAARFARVPSVVNAISGKGRLFAAETLLGRARAALVRAVYRATLRHPNMAIIFQNDEDRATFIRAGIATERSSFLIGGSGTELKRFDANAEPEMPPIVLFVGRILRQKGITEFVTAARALKAAKVNARFAVAGDSAGNRDALSARELRKIRDDGVVEFWGWSDDMPAVMGRAAIICLPSYHEGVPKALLDACAAGRPIVATDIAGCRAVVTAGKNGLLVPPRDATSLANALRILISDPALRARMGAESLKIAPRFAIEVVVDATLSVYAALAGTPGIGIPRTCPAA